MHITTMTATVQTSLTWSRCHSLITTHTTTTKTESSASPSNVTHRCNIQWRAASDKSWASSYQQQYNRCAVPISFR